MNNKVKVLVDWLTFTARDFEDPSIVITEYLGMNPLLFMPCGTCLSGYRQCLGYNGIKICFDPREDANFRNMGIAVSMSGNGCRTFENSTSFTSDDKQGLHQSAFAVLFNMLHAKGEFVNVTRVDLACDNHEGLLDMDEIVRKVDYNEVRTNMKTRSVVKSWFGRTVSGQTAYIGSAKSEFFIRFYNKRLERGDLDKDYHWVRCEMVLRGVHATAFVDLFVNTDDIGTIAAAILNDKMCFVDMDDSNISRCTPCQWWLDFVDSIDSVHIIARAPAKHTVDEKLDWLRWQISPMLAVIRETKGFSEFLNLLDFGAERLSAKHHALINDYKDHFNGYTE